MAEPSLAIAWIELQARIGTFLGYGRGASYGDIAWSSAQQFELDGITASGLRQFYNPPPMEGQESSYDWSFLKPVATMNLPSGANTMMLPDDYGGFEGRITLASGTVGNQFWPVELVGVGQVYAKQTQLPTTTGRPLIACEEPVKGTANQTGQRFQLRFWPKTDTGYTIQFAYYVNPDYLSANLPYAYGGAQHAETILESCLAIAEKRLDNESTVHAQEFVTRLSASISADRRLKPQTLGPCLDRSDAMWGSYGRDPWNHYNDNITVYGVQY